MMTRSKTRAQKNTYKSEVLSVLFVTAKQPLEKDIECESQCYDYLENNIIPEDAKVIKFGSKDMLITYKITDDDSCIIKDECLDNIIRVINGRLDDIKDEKLHNIVKKGYTNIIICINDELSFYYYDFDNINFETP